MFRRPFESSIQNARAHARRSPDFPPSRIRLRAVTRESEIEQEDRADDRLKLRRLRRELAVRGPDEEAEDQREKGRVKTDHRPIIPLEAAT